MIEIKVEGSLQAALKKLKIKCQQTGLMGEIKKHRERTKPTEVKRKKKLKAIRREKRRMMKIERKRKQLF